MSSPLDDSKMPFPPQMARFQARLRGPPGTAWYRCYSLEKAGKFRSKSRSFARVGPAEAARFLEGFDGFVTSSAAPRATGWSDQLPGGNRIR